VPPSVTGTRGFGIHIMRELMDELEYTERGTRIHLMKKSRARARNGEPLPV
jgi:anti-sigma regulatory factor (Ser/Thr protein kinase)